MAIQQGMNQQTPATQHIIRKAMGAGATTRRRRRSSAATKPRVKRARASRGSSRKKMVKGSAAAKAWGRKMKRHRKR